MADINKTGKEVAKMILSIGNASDLRTEAKTTIVEAVNEIFDYVAKIARAIAVEKGKLAKGETTTMVEVEGVPISARAEDMQTGEEILCELKYESDAVIATIKKAYDHDIEISVEYIMD